MPVKRTYWGEVTGNNDEIKVIEHIATATLSMDRRKHIPAAPTIL